MEIGDEIGPYPDNPDEPYDVFISDVSPADLSTSVSTALGTPYLSIATIPTQWPVSGIVFGRHKRIFFSMPVSVRNSSVQVHFLFDTGTPRTYIASAVLTALGLPEISLCSELVRINGVKEDVSVSDTTKILHVNMPCHFAGLNIMGMDFLDRLEGILTVDMSRNTARLDRGR